MHGPHGGAGTGEPLAEPNLEAFQTGALSSPCPFHLLPGNEDTRWSIGKGEMPTLCSNSKRLFCHLIFYLNVSAFLFLLLRARNPCCFTSCQTC
jgi:hypothetical protein